MPVDYPEIHLPATEADSAGVAQLAVSVIILTFNEERNIADCLRSCAWCDDVHVLDSGSTDRTVEIARLMGATVHTHLLQSFAEQRNWAIDNIPTKHRWQFHLDADERITAPLVEEMIELLGPDGTRGTMAAYQVPSMLIFLGKWVRHASGYPSAQVRLFHHGRCRFTAFGFGQCEQARGPVGAVLQPLLHFSLSNGLVEWLRKHNRYSDTESAQAILLRRKPAPLRQAILDRDPHVRRRALKDLSYFPRCRALWRFLYSYLGRGGWLDGKPGFHYCALMAIYEYWIELKIREHERAWQPRTAALAEQITGDDAAESLTSDPSRPSPVDVMIPTLNEAAHIARTVRNARSLGNVYVLDSGSTDGTQQLARDAGAVVVEHPFSNYAAQKNWGIDHLPFTGEWIFILDADEHLTPGLRREIKRMLKEYPDRAVGYYINRALIFMGRNVRHGGLYPSWNLRLFRRGKARYEERMVHEHMVCDGATDYLPGEMVHIRTESIHRYIAKHIHYADLESNEWVNIKLGRSTTAPSHQLFTRALRYRSWLRRVLWPRMPMRPLWRFLHMYIVRFGFLDGRAGWHLARLMSSYEYMIGLLFEDKMLRARFGNAQMSPQERDRQLAARVARRGK
jgi:glycosyltransferase involved in cell wall biosynthesis